MPPISFEDLVNRKKAVTKTVYLTLDPGLAGELEEARQARDHASRAASFREKDHDAQAALWQAEERVAQLEQRLVDEDAVVAFTFRSIGRAAFSALVDAHQPTAAQRAKVKTLGLGNGGMLWNPDTFPAALIAACLEEPKLTEEQALALWSDDSWNAAELQELLEAAVEVNETRRMAELGKDSAKIRSSGRS